MSAGTRDPVSSAAQAAVLAARAAAGEMGLGITVAVCDAGGHLLALQRDPRALLASLESAQSKARTALYFGTETRHLPADAPITPALLAAMPQALAFLPGGIPLLRTGSGELVGAVGIGGGAPAQDQTVVEAAAAAWRVAYAGGPA